jgi:hypothetical protein
VDVDVRHLQARYHGHRARHAEGADLRVADVLGDDRDVREGDVVEIGEPGDLLPGDHEDVAVRDGLVGADRDAHVVGPDEAAGDLACDDS